MPTWGHAAAPPARKGPAQAHTASRGPRTGRNGMQLLALGLNHQTAPLALRERVAFLPEEIEGAIARLRARFAAVNAGTLSEAAIVSTCNRTELYCAVEEPERAAPTLSDFVAE